MKKALFIQFLFIISFSCFSQIIADHTVVDRFDDIPQYYIDEVKKTWLVVAGESHGRGYINGLDLIEATYPKFAVSTAISGSPDPYTSLNLRASSLLWGDLDNTSGWVNWYGEEDWWTTPLAISRTKAGITYCNTHSLSISAMLFAHCFDPAMSDNYLLNYTAYINATQEYIDYCASHGYPTKVIFTTLTCDMSYSDPDLDQYNKWRASELIRDYVLQDPTRILFDYYDILCYDDYGNGPETAKYGSSTYNIIHPGNDYDDGSYHISNAGQVRIAKALWWMMARIAGWDGEILSVPITGITVTGAGGATTITQDNGQLQLTATVQPSDATNKTVTWSVVNGTGQATINSTGLVTAVANGTVTARATANDGSGIVGSLVITITGQVIPVTGITVTGAGGASTITQDNGQLQLTATVQPSDATNKTVTWSVVNGTGQATINSTGLVTAVSNGTVTARATANDGSGIVGSLVITITGQVIPVTGITVTGAGGSTTITQDNGQLQLTATVAPANATNKAVTWSITNGTGQATINATGLVTAVSAGTVTAVATANDGSGVQGSLVITISNQIIPVTSITVTGSGGATSITQDNGQLQLTAAVQPSDATNKTVTWSVVNGTGQATINSTGLVTAVSNGTVTARATANDGSGIVGSLVITITGQVIPVTGISVTGAGGSSVINSDGGQLQLTATVVPSGATNKTVTWSVVNGTGQATISATGLVTAISNGNLTARATANDGSGIVGSLVITITGQVIPVTGITVTGAGGSTTITQDNGQLQLTATVYPSDATNKTVTWSIVNGTGQATINSTGLVTAVSNGTVTARATANDGSGIVGSLVITITGQVIPVTGITVTGAGGSSVITSDGGQLQLTATVTPANATNKTVTWSIVNSTGQATINTTGLVTAVSGGTVTAVAVANDGSGVQGTMAITITYQFIPVTGITITGAGGATTIAQDKGTLALTATIVPSNATNKSVTWSLLNGTGQATISASGVVTAVANGTVTARSTANDGTGIFGELVISISGQTIQVTKITVAAAKGEPVISTNKGTLQLSFIILPENATNKTVTWSIGGGTGQASVNSNGLVTAIADGTVVVRAMATDGSGVFGEITVSIINQIVLVTGITVTGEGSITTISIDDGTLRMLATVNPSNASNKSVTWSIVSGNGHAGLSEEGILTARTNGKVVIRATSNDGSNVYGQVEITITNQIVSVSSIKVKVKTKSSTTTTVNGELALEAEIFPEDATQKDISWSVVNGTGAAIISESGILKGITPGEVIVVATSLDGSGVVGELAITINLVESIKIRYTRNEIIIQVPEHLLPAKASLHNLYGSHMQSKVIDSTECIFDITELLPGVYVVSVYNSIVQDAAKIIVAY